MPFRVAFLPTPPASKARGSAPPPRCASTHAAALPPVPPRHSGGPSTPLRRPRAARTSCPRPRFHAQNIQRLASAGDLTAMQCAIRTAVADGFELSAINYTTIANAHAAHGDPAHVFAVLSLMRAKGIPPTNVTLRVAIKACDAWRVEHAAVEALLTALTWNAQRGTDAPDARTWNLALRAFARKGATDQMLRVLAWMRNGATDCLPGVATFDDERVPKPTACSYNTCLHALGKQGRFREAVGLFADMLVRNRGSQRLDLDIVTYNTLLEIAVNVHRFSFPDDDADAVGNHPAACDPISFVNAITNSMLRHGVHANITTETLILRLLTRKHAVPPNPEYIRNRMRPVLSDYAQFQYKPDKKYFDALITAFAHAADVDGVSTAFEEMNSRGVRTDFLTVRALLVAARHIGDVKLATRIIDVSHDLGLQADDHMYTTAITTCARAEPPDPESADHLLNHALERGTVWSPSMINAAISSYNRDVSKALDLWKRLSTCQDPASTVVLRDQSVYHALVRVCGRSARPDVALRIFYAAKNANHLAINTPESRTVFNAFMRGIKEADAEMTVSRNPLKRQYLQHLKAECGVVENFDIPIERIRIKF